MKEGGHMTFAIMMFRTVIWPFVIKGTIPSLHSLYEIFTLLQNSFILNFRHENMHILK